MRKARLNNLEVRKAMKAKGILYKELALACAISPVTLSRWLQNELTEERKQELLKIIEGQR